MVDVTPEYLLNIVDEETAIKIWEQLEGMRIYFPKNIVKHNNIKRDYKIMMGKYYPKAEAIKELSCKYELSADQIRRITKKECEVFESF